MTDAARRELVTLPDPERTPTLPAPPNLSPVQHEDWLALLRVYTDLGATDRSVVLSIAQCLRPNPLDVTGELRWVLSVREGDGETINWRSGGRR